MFTKFLTLICWSSVRFIANVLLVEINWHNSAMAAELYA